jgi:hypothetical protein
MSCNGSGCMAHGHTIANVLLGNTSANSLQQPNPSAVCMHLQHECSALHAMPIQLTTDSFY